MDVSNRDRPPSRPPPSVHGSCELTNIVDEYVDRERRKSNVIVYNLPEVDPEQPDKLPSDTDSFSNMVSNGLGIDGFKVSKMYRLGKKVENKSRPLLVSLDTPSMRATLLSKSATLRKSEHWKMCLCPQI